MGDRVRLVIDRVRNRSFTARYPEKWLKYTLLVLPVSLMGFS